MTTNDSTGASPRVYGHAGARHHSRAAAGSTETQRGSTAHFTVFYAGDLGADGPVLADAVLSRCEQDYASLQGFFGGITPAGLPFEVHIQPGSNGASHAGCAATALTCDAFSGTDGALVSSLVVAEADEVFMADQAAGWDCGASNGEGLSRVLAAELYPAEQSPPGTGISFATAAAWLNSDRPDFVTQNDPTDQNPVSTGCATLFINYLRHQLNYSLNQIVQAGGATLADTYTTLTGRGDAFAAFSALLAGAFPPGQQVNLTNDNPFPLPGA